MNPFHLDTTGLLLWGVVAHLVADWLLQNEYMANNKMKRFSERPKWADGRWEKVAFWFTRHPAAYVHSSIHGALLALVFGWVAIPLAIAHLVIDTRAPVEWWSKLMRQTQPTGVSQSQASTPFDLLTTQVPLVDVGLFVRFWNDQVWHIVCLAIAALVVG